jgi:hypothetical protein
MENKLNFEAFELPFIIDSIETIEDDDFEEKELRASEVKENMESLIPEQTIFLGCVDSEIENWTSWNINDNYYLYPLIDNDYDWALFRISWDDNWGRWVWVFDARLKGCVGNYKNAASILIAELWDKWKLDLNDSKNAAFADFLNRLNKNN